MPQLLVQAKETIVSRGIGKGSELESTERVLLTVYEDDGFQLEGERKEESCASNLKDKWESLW